MQTRLIPFLCGTFVCAAMALSATAFAADKAPPKAPGFLPDFFKMFASHGCRTAQECWLHAHRGIYHKHELIAYLEANPDVDDSVKGPLITRLHHKMLAKRARIGPRWPVWPTPCCYSRKPIYVR